MTKGSKGRALPKLIGLILAWGTSVLTIAFGAIETQSPWVLFAFIPVGMMSFMIVSANKFYRWYPTTLGAAYSLMAGIIAYFTMLVGVWSFLLFWPVVLFGDHLVEQLHILFKEEDTTEGKKDS